MFAAGVVATRMLCGEACHPYEVVEGVPNMTHWCLDAILRDATLGDTACDVLQQMCTPDPHARPSATDVLGLQWFSQASLRY